MKHKIICILMLILLVACTTQKEICEKPYITAEDGCCIDENSNDICDDKEIKVIEPDKEEVIVLKAELPERDFTMEELKNYISGLDSTNYRFDKDTADLAYLKEAEKGGESFLPSNRELKTWVIHKFDTEQLDDMQAFYDFTNARKWQAWRYYINETRWNWLDDPLTPEEVKELFPSYNDYDENDMVHVDVSEEPIEKDGRSVLLYRLDTMTFDKQDYWEDMWETTKAIYKIPCTKDIIVYYKPKMPMDFGYAVPTNQKEGSGKRQIQNEIDANKVKAKLYAEKIMDFCGITPDMFDVKFEPYTKSKQKVRDFKYYFKTRFNYSFSAEVTTEQVGSKLKITSFTIDFTPHEAYGDLKEDDFYVDVLINDSGNVNRHIDWLVETNSLLPGKTYRQTLTKDSERFSKGSSIIFMPYLLATDKGRVQHLYFGEPHIRKV